MAKHRPAHARSGLGRYTPPRRIHPAHAMLSAQGSGRGRLAGGVIGGSAIATAGFLALAAMPAGAVSASLSTPFFGFYFEHGSNVATTTLAPGVPGIALAVAGSFGPGFGSRHNTATASVTGPFGVSIALAGAGAFEDSSHNTATASSSGLALPGFGGSPGFALSAAGSGFFADDSGNTSSATGVGGLAISLAGDGSFAHDSGNSAISTAFGGPLGPSLAVAVAGFGDFAHHVDNSALASAIDGGSAIALAGSGDFSHSSHNTAIASANIANFLLGGGAIAIASEGSHNTALAGASGSLAAGPTLFYGAYSSATAIAGRGNGNIASADGYVGGALAIAGQGSDNTAGASASGTIVPGSGATAIAGDGDGNSAYAGATGIDANADADAAAGTVTVGATSQVGSDSYADATLGDGTSVWATSLNGGTVIS